MMKFEKILLILAAFLIMISSVFTLYQSNGTDKIPVYINLAAMVAIAIAVSIRSYKKPGRRDY